MLDLTSALTLEAWVFPTVVPSGWSTILHKDVDRYYLTAGSDNQSRPVIGGTFGSSNQNLYGTASLPVNAWTHLPGTYNRTTIQLYVNGTQVGTERRRRQCRHRTRC
jgi:Concanavalin A-like lectin/glucanases superfamily